MTKSTKVPQRVAAALAATAVVALYAAPASAASDDGVEVVNTETIQVYTDATGKVDTKRVYEQLSMTGNGSVDLSNPIETDGLRNLDGFGGFDVEDGNQITRTTVEGSEHLRSVSSFDGDLPLEVEVTYLLDGKEVEPGDVVGEDGKLEVLYSVRNVTAAPQEVSFPDGKGGTVTKTVEVPIPIVGSLTTLAPENFTDVQSKQANMAGDGRGATKLSFTMTLFPPLGSDTAEFGYTAQITDGVVPRADISALPVNPLESPTFASAATSYKGGADTGTRLAEGASTIDANLLKLRDGASELLAGLIKLNDGSNQLSEGLNGAALPGANKLADGSVELADGSGKAFTGSQDLSDGLGLISGGLGKLANANTGLPAAKNGAAKLKAGVDLLISKLGTTSNPQTLIGGLAKLENGLGLLEAGAGQLHGGLQILVGNVPAQSPGLKGAKNGVDLVKSGLDASLAPGGDLDRLVGGLSLLDGAFCPLTGGATTPTPNGPVTCTQLVGGLVAGVNGPTGSRAKLTLAAGGLGQVSTGLATAIGGLETQLIPGAAQISAGLTEAKAGAGKLEAGAVKFKGGMVQVSDGLGKLSDGLTAAVSGVLQLSGGAQTAYAGSQDLAAGLGRLDAGANKIADGNGELAAGLGDAASGSERLADGLSQAAGGAPKLVDGAQRLSDEGTKKLVEAGVDTAQNYGEMYATLTAGAERAQTEKMAYGAPEGAFGLTAYSYVIKGENGEGGRNLARGLAGLGLLGAGAGAFALRRRFI